MKKKYTVLFICFCLTLTLFGCTNRQMTPGQDNGGSTPYISSTYEKADVCNMEITDGNTVARAGTSDNSPQITKLSSGSNVKVLGKADGYYIVQLPNGRVATIPVGSAKLTAPPKTEAIPEVQGTAGNTLANEESAMLNLINGERAKAGVKPLSANTELTKVARLKSKDMVDKNYFSHTSPTYGSPFEMMKRFGISYMYAGENLAMNQTVDAAHRALMNSEGHRKNILNPDFTEIGIGIMSKSGNNKIYTQMFIGK